MISGRDIFDFLQAMRKKKRSIDEINETNFMKFVDIHTGEKAFSNSTDAFTVIYKNFLKVIEMKQENCGNSLQKVDFQNSLSKSFFHYKTYYEINSQEKFLDASSNEYGIYVLFYHYFSRIISILENNDLVEKYTKPKEYLHEHLTHSRSRTNQNSTIIQVCNEIAEFINFVPKSITPNIRRENIVKNIFYTPTFNNNNLRCIQILGFEGSGKSYFFTDLQQNNPDDWRIHLITISGVDITRDLQQLQKLFVNDVNSHYHNISIIFDNMDQYRYSYKKALDDFIDNVTKTSNANKINLTFLIASNNDIKDISSLFIDLNYDIQKIYFEEFSKKEVVEFCEKTSTGIDPFQLYSLSNGYPEIVNYILSDPEYELDIEKYKEIFLGIMKPEDKVQAETYLSLRKVLLYRFLNEGKIDTFLQSHGLDPNPVNITGFSTKLVKLGIITDIDTYEDQHNHITRDYFYNSNWFVNSTIRFVIRQSLEFEEFNKACNAIIHNYKQEYNRVLKNIKPDEKILAFLLREIYFHTLNKGSTLDDLHRANKDIYKIASSTSLNLVFSYFHYLVQEDEEIINLLLNFKRN